MEFHWSLVMVGSFPQRGEEVLMCDLMFALPSHQALLFNPAKPFWRGTGSQNADVELMMDCFVSCFRLNPHNNQHFKVKFMCTFATL